MARRSDPSRRGADGTTSPLPSLTSLTPDDRVYLRMMIALAETGSMFQGRYVEAHVARVIGAQIPNTGTSPWDLYLPGERNLRIEVKSTAGGGSFKANALDKEVDLWVFVTHSHEGKTRRPHGFRYAVGTRTRLEKAFSGRHAIGGEELLSRLGVIADADALRSAIGRHQQRPGRRSGRQL